MKAFIILVAALLAVNSVVAQDLLVKRNGEQMKVKVLKITKKKVQFVRHGTELPVYTLPISDIEYIEYPMGDRDTFGRNVETPAKHQTTQEPEKWHGPVAIPDGSLSKEYKVESAGDKSEPETPRMWHGAVRPHNGKTQEVVAAKSNNTAEQVYSLGDIYDKNGVKGIVVMLYDGGRHGLVMSLDEACLAWSKLGRKQIKKTGANNQFNGDVNMLAIEKYIAENSLSWSDFPAFEWCRAKGAGWYLPSINEIWSAGTMYLGGSRTSESRRFRKNFNASITNAGGTPLSNLMFYHSSTEDNNPKYSKYSHMNSEPPHIQSGYKADELYVRAFHKF